MSLDVTDDETDVAALPTDDEETRDQQSVYIYI